MNLARGHGLTKRKHLHSKNTSKPLFMLHIPKKCCGFIYEQIGINEQKK